MSAESRLEIRQVNAADANEMAVFQEIYEQAERAEFPDADVFTLEDAIAVLTRTPLGWLYQGYAAFESGRMVGEALIIASTIDNLRTADFWVWVPPQHRGRGVGREIAEYVMTECRELGRDVLQTTAKYPFERRDDHPYRRFAERLGFSLANTEVERRLVLPVPDELLDKLAADAAPHHQAYTILPVVGPVPAELAQGYCDVINRLTIDAPGGDLVVEERQRTPEVLTDQEDEIREQGRTRVSVFALDSAGSVAALTSSVVSGPGQPGVNQWATIVRPDDRGHRLGIAVKVAQIRTIQTSFPDKRFVTTTNAETNALMVGINEALGFERRALMGDFQLIATPDRSHAEGVHPAAQKLGTGIA